MPIEDFQKLQILWKRTQFGVAQTSGNKDPYEESEQSPLAIFSSDIWQEDNAIPFIPAEIQGVVEFVSGVMYRDVTVEGYTTYLAYKSELLGQVEENRVRDFIPTAKGGGYEIKIYRDVARTDLIESNDPAYSWEFDYSAGVMWIPGNLETLDNLYFEGFVYIGKKGVGPIFTGDQSDVIKTPSSGSYEGGYVDDLVSNETTVADAFDKINRALNDFRPAGPLPLSNFTITIPGLSKTINEAQIVLADGYEGFDALNAKPAGTPVGRVYGTRLESEVIGPFGNGREGTITVNLNGVTQSGKVLTPDSNVGTFGSLQILTDEIFPTGQPGFYDALTARLVDMPIVDGINVVNMQHTLTGITPDVVYFKDTSNVKPTVWNVDIEDVISDNILLSSGIPHYGRETVIKLTATASGLATDLTLDTKNVIFDTIPSILPKVWAVPGRNSLPAVLQKDTTYTVDDVVFTVDNEDGNAHGSVIFNATAWNANGASAFAVNTSVYNIMCGNDVTTLASPVLEKGIPVINVGKPIDGASFNAIRILQENGRTPAWTYGNVVPAPYNSNVLKETWEAAIVGGRIIASKEDYRSQFPAGPDYRFHFPTQYATFAFRRLNVQNFGIEIEGTYSSLAVSLPGPTAFPLVANNWLDAMQPYSGIGTPGIDDQSGCALGVPALGGSQLVKVTFGRENSNNSYNNIILVRIGLGPEQQVTGLRFVGI